MSIPSFGSMYPVTVPGTIDGWATLLDECGTMSLSEVLQPAIDYAEKGFSLSARKLVSHGKKSAQMLAEHPDTARTYLKNGRAPAPRGNLLSTEPCPNISVDCRGRPRCLLSRGKLLTKS